MLLKRLCFLSGRPLWNSETEQEYRVERLRDPFTGRMMLLPVDGFQEAARLVLFTDANYIVICPGKEPDLVRLARDAGPQWKNVPFVVDDEELTISTSLTTVVSMRIEHGQAMPAILEYDGTNGIVDFGRGWAHINL
jgi:hypothetical protein